MTKPELAEELEDVLAEAMAPIRHELQTYGYKRVRVLEIDRRLARAALTALRNPSTSTVEEWQDIESAPKDETPVLLWFPRLLPWSRYEGEHITIGFYSPDATDYPEDQRWFENEADSHSLASFALPTHWRPLPSPPSTGMGR